MNWKLVGIVGGVVVLVSTMFAWALAFVGGEADQATDAMLFRKKLRERVCEDLQSQGHTLDPELVRLEVTGEGLRIFATPQDGVELELALRFEVETDHWVIDQAS